MCSNRLCKKLKQNSAFTLQEMLIAVAVLVVLFAISMPAVANLLLRLKMTELDNHAKTIFLEAQNQLVAMKAEGSMPQFYKDIQENYRERFLGSAPHDYDIQSNGEDWQNLCYLTKSDSATAVFIPENTNTYQMEGDYLVEINPLTGDIYGVFYWEKNEKINYASHIQELFDRTSEERSTIEIGYYGGQIENTISTDFSLGQQVEVINGEELYVKISYAYSERLVKYYDSLEITCYVEDENGNIWKGSVNSGDYILGNRIEYYVLLDSMEQNKSFTDITEDVLVAGDNLTITVKGEFSRGLYHKMEESTPVVVNSLFDEKTYSSEDGLKIEVAKLRHFRNLAIYKYQDEKFDNPYVRINQTDDIDFENGSFAWSDGQYKGVGLGERPINSLTPIANTDLFVNGGGDDVTEVYGNGYELKNFLVNADAGTHGVGIWANVENVSFVNLRIEDILISASEYENVGALVGSIKNGTIQDCGVYLTIHNGEMEERYDKYCVTGDETIGGLIGAADNTTISNSFAAVKVNGTANAGGLIGEITDSVVENCYASGDVSASGNIAGGFVGTAASTVFKNIYVTSNPLGEDYVGGFAGNSTQSTYTDCNAYGQVFDITGENVPNHAGGFIYEATAGSNTYNNCKYLRQEAYNATGLVDNEDVVAQGYTAFLATSENAITGMSFPYDNLLSGQSFPFVPVIENQNHYGNWPVQYVINTSLVYYEKYKDGTYGYYCVTTLADNDETAQVNQYIWVLDTLKDEACVEDGYALLSMKNLSRYSYDVHIGSESAVSLSGTLTVVDDYSGNEDAVNRQTARLRQQGALTFYAYSEQMEDYSGATPQDQFVVDGMYLYQLPYNLQCTERYDIENFYDKLVIYAGYAVGNDEAGATPVLGGTNANSGVSFFYSPHFAKTAVNPNTDGSNESQLLNPAYVYVRSARQLNALGRYPYYWNDKGGLANKITYVQESDVDFGTYGTYVDDTKMYCGVEFDLMDVDSEIANIPIGVPEIGAYWQFRNIYDGMGNKIIDYRVKSDQIFVGLFGEIRDAVIRNVVMTVSEKGAGYIISSGLPDNSDTKVAVGALVGSSYMHGNTISNCSVSGYIVQYELQTPGRGENQIVGLAVGGLVGFSMSEITHCTAANDVRVVSPTDFDGPIFIGGLAGSAFFEPVSYCYTGGTIDIEVSTGVELDGTVAIAGICPGYYYTWYEEGAALRGDYDYLYSYTQVLTDSSVYNYLFGTVGNLVEAESGRTTFDANECYYLAQAFPNGVNRLEMGTSISYAGLAALEGMGNPVSGVESTYPYDNALVEMAYPFPTVITSADGTIHLHYGDWPLEGEEPEPGPDPQPWPDRLGIVNSDTMNEDNYVGLFYYESYDDDGDGDADSYGIYAIGYTSGDRANTEPELLINTLASAEEAEEKVLQSGYGVFYQNGNQWDVRNGWNWTDINQYGSSMTNIFPNSIEDYSIRLIQANDSLEDSWNTFSREIRWYQSRQNNREYEIEIPDIRTVRPQ